MIISHKNNQKLILVNPISDFTKLENMIPPSGLTQFSKLCGGGRGKLENSHLRTQPSSEIPYWVQKATQFPRLPAHAPVIYRNTSDASIGARTARAPPPKKTNAETHNASVPGNSGGPRPKYYVRTIHLLVSVMLPGLHRVPKRLGPGNAAQ